MLRRGCPTFPVQCNKQPLFSVLITTMNILPLCSHPSITPKEKGEEVKDRRSLHTPKFSGLSGVYCVPGSNPADA